MKGKGKIKSLTKHAKDNIREIHALSSLYNGTRDEHTKKLLDMAEEHAEEIAELFRKKDPHFYVELGDLLVLCLEILIEKGKDPDAIMDLSYNRFKKKLSALILKRNNAKRRTQ